MEIISFSPEDAEAIKPWIHKKVKEILGFEEDTVVAIALDCLNRKMPKIEIQGMICTFLALVIVQHLRHPAIFVLLNMYAIIYSTLTFTTKFLAIVEDCTLITLFTVLTEKLSELLQDSANSFVGSLFEKLEQSSRNHSKRKRVENDSKKEKKRSRRRFVLTLHSSRVPELLFFK